MSLQRLFSVAIMLIGFSVNALSQCNLPPGEAFNPYSFRIDTSNFSNDSHTYNPYSSSTNDVANLFHEPKAPGEKGHWVSKEYRVNAWGSLGMYRDTYITATIVNSKGNPDTYGGFLSITNESKVYPAYFGLGATLDDRLLPRQSRTINLSIYQPGSGPKHAVSKLVYLKYWDDEAITAGDQGAASSPCPTMLEYYKSLDATSGPVYRKIRNHLPWKYLFKVSLPASGTQNTNFGAVTRITTSHHGANIAWSITNDSNFPIFIDEFCNYSNGRIDSNPVYIAIPSHSTRNYSGSVPTARGSSGDCSLSMMEGPAETVRHPTPSTNIDEDLLNGMKGSITKQ